MILLSFSRLEIIEKTKIVETLRDEKVSIETKLRTTIQNNDQLQNEITMLRKAEEDSERYL